LKEKGQLPRDTVVVDTEVLATALLSATILSFSNFPLLLDNPLPLATVLSFSNGPILATTLSYLSFRAQRGICGAPFGCLTFIGLQPLFRLPRLAMGSADRK
jgi:hypothetical protein